MDNPFCRRWESAARALRRARTTTHTIRSSGSATVMAERPPGARRAAPPAPGQMGVRAAQRSAARLLHPRKHEPAPPGCGGEKPGRRGFFRRGGRQPKRRPVQGLQDHGRDSAGEGNAASGKERHPAGRQLRLVFAVDAHRRRRRRGKVQPGQTGFGSTDSRIRRSPSRPIRRPSARPAPAGPGRRAGRHGIGRDGGAVQHQAVSPRVAPRTGPASPLRDGRRWRRAGAAGRPLIQRARSARSRSPPLAPIRRNSSRNSSPTRSRSPSRMAQRSACSRRSSFVPIAGLFGDERIEMGQGARRRARPPGLQMVDQQTRETGSQIHERALRDSTTRLNQSRFPGRRRCGQIAPAGIAQQARLDPERGRQDQAQAAKRRVRSSAANRRWS